MTPGLTYIAHPAHQADVRTPSSFLYDIQMHSQKLRVILENLDKLYLTKPLSWYCHIQCMHAWSTSVFLALSSDTLVDNEILLMKKMLKLSELCELYITTLNTTKHPNPNCRRGEHEGETGKH